MPPSLILEEFTVVWNYFCTIFGFGNQTVYYTIERLVLKKCSIGIKGTGCLIRGSCYNCEKWKKGSSKVQYLY